MNILKNYYKIIDEKISLGKEDELSESFSSFVKEIDNKLENKPKRPKNPFIFFFTENKDKIKNEYPKMNQREIIKKSGEKWKNLKQDEKEIYIKMYQKDKIRYLEEKV